MTGWRARDGLLYGSGIGLGFGLIGVASYRDSLGGPTRFGMFAGPPVGVAFLGSLLGWGGAKDRYLIDQQ
ncbi:hypothetical protein BH23BAC4_BH23BAC4_13340 [soil metagenome]